MAGAPVLVTTPDGNVGREVVRALLERGHAVRAGVRDPGRVQAPDGVEVVRLDFEDPATFGPATRGANGLFLLRPTQIARVKSTLNRLVDAAAEAGVGHCVFQSISGAERQPWLPHRKVEQHLERSPMGWTFLRANHFMQNLTGPYRSTILAGRLALPAGNGRIAFVDCADLGDVAAMALCDPDAHRNRAYHLTGPEAVDFAQVAELLSKTLGRRVVYEPVGPLRYARDLKRDGATVPYTLILTMLHITVRRGAAEAVDGTLERVLGRPSRTLREFIARHAGELGGSAVPDGQPA
jgi:uncharacterized protein YbjT (DUF2867 family)